uniref:Conserved oligomeric Golgi complex subunit 5 n=1 Tax=Anopheles minimus TaxID=112268 RepID=A0A182WLB4_9DIPT
MFFFLDKQNNSSRQRVVWQTNFAKMTDELCDKIENDEFYKNFLADKPSPELQLTVAISDQITKLSEGIEQLSGALQKQVREQYGALLSQAKHAGTLNASIESISSHIETLRFGAERLRRQITVPYEVLETQTKVLGRLHEASHVLRQCARFLQVHKELDNTTDLAEQAGIVNELEGLMEDVDLTKIEFLREEIATVKKAKQRLLKVANRDLFEGILKNKPDQVGVCVRIFHNLKILPKCLNNVLETFSNYLKDAIKESFAGTDVAKLRKTGASSPAKERHESRQLKAPGKAPALTNSSNFRTKLWQALEWLFLDEMYGHCTQVLFLQKCLLELPLGDEYTLAREFDRKFWTNLEKQLVSSFKSAQSHVTQTLQQGLPKLLSLARGLETKIDQHFTFGEKVFGSLEAGYLEKCANNFKVALADIDFPNQEVIDALVRVASAELNAAIVDPRLIGLVTGVLCVSNKDLWNKIERNVKLGSETQQVLDNPNVSQSQNITLANVIYYHHEAINRLVSNLGTKFSALEASKRLTSSLVEGKTITMAILQPLIASIHSAVNVILLSMHREPGLNANNISTTGPSLYMKELQDFIVRSWNTHILPFNDRAVIEEAGRNLAIRCIELFVQNLATIRPISFAGRQRLKADCHHLEGALKPIVPDLSSLGKSFRLLRAIASLFTATPQELVEQTADEGGVVPPYIVLFMLFGHAGNDMASPHATAGWGNEKLLQWLESHSAERERLELITGALQKYRSIEMAAERLIVLLALVLVIIVEVQSSPLLEKESSATTVVETGRQRGPFHYGVYPFGWGWGIAAFVIAIVKGAFWLGIIMIWAFFKGFPAKHGCAPIILRESVPYYHDHHHDHHEEIIWDKPPHRRRSIRQVTQPGEESDLLLTDMITDLAFSFLGVHTTDCRKRFVCEVDVRAKSDYLLKLGTRMFGVDIFRKYRSADDVSANSIEQCAELYGKCHAQGSSITMNVFDGQIKGSIDDYDEAVANQEQYEVHRRIMAFLKQLLLLAAMLVLVAAQDLAESTTKSVDEGRRRKRFTKFFFKALGPIMSTLATVVLVKAKIVLVALFFAGIYFFGHKIFPGGFFGSSFISETPPPFIESSPYTSYHSGHEIISSYPGPEPYSSFEPPSSSYGSPSPTYGPPSNAYLPPTGDSSSYSSYSKFSGTRRKRDVEGRQSTAGTDPNEDDLEDNEMYWTDTLTDMTFRFLGVNRRVCRKRFVCEFDFQARRNPILLFVTRAIGRDVFHNYRDAGDERAINYKDCGRIYEDCKVPKRKKFIRRPVRPLLVQQQFPSSDSNGYDNMQDNEIDSTESKTETTTTIPSISPISRSKLILLPKNSNNRFQRN